MGQWLRERVCVWHGRCWVVEHEWQVWNAGLLVQHGVVWRRPIFMCCLVVVWLPVVWSYLCCWLLSVVTVLRRAVHSV